MKKLLCLSLVFVVSAATILNAQDIHPEEEHQSDHHSEFSPHRIGVLMGYGIISGAVDKNGNKTPLIIPLIALDYEYWFNHKIGLGLLNDLELSSYAVEYQDLEYLERSYAFITSIIFLYEPIKNWVLFAGPGYEFEGHHNFPLLKIGTEIGKTFEGGWGLGFALSFDIKEENSAMSLGLAASKRFGK